MFGNLKGAPATTQAVDPWNAAGQNLRDVGNPGMQFNKEGLNKLAAMPQAQQPQFSPVQFGGGGGDPQLLMLIEEMKKRGF